MPRTSQRVEQAGARGVARPSPAPLTLRPSRACVVGFQRVPDLRQALAQARRQRLRVRYVHRDQDGTPVHAVIEWRGKPVVVTDAFDGTEIL